MDSNKFDSLALLRFSRAVLQTAGLAADRADAVAHTLVEADLMGHTTHGLQLLSPYLRELESGLMTKDGEPEVLSDQQSALTWDGGYLPGPWLVNKAIDLALERLAVQPVITIAIRKSHHIGCLAAYPERVVRQGFMMLLSCSDPKNRTVAPFGGLSPVYSPNPLAVGIPTLGEPIIFDISMSATANGYVNRAAEEGKRLPHKWLLDNRGNPTDDPTTFLQDPPATILPLGGIDSGYKGFALGIMIEAMTGALAGYGRAEEPGRWGASVFLQLINPAAFGGTDAFKREMQFLADACHSSAAKDAGSIRLPGERAFRLRDEQKSEGLELYPSILPALRQLAEKYQLDFPDPLS